MQDRKQRLLAIIRAFERVRLASPPRGPGWSVCFKDEHDHLLLSFSLDSYQHVDDLAREVADLGFALTILEGSINACDFVFRQDSGDAPLAPRDAGRRVALPPLQLPSQKFAKGALVMEDAGGPVMLLSALSRDLAYCVWFSETAQVCSGTFMLNRLVNVDGARRRPVALPKVANVGP
ncbi:MAG TPA: hypothetical protein VIL30_26700 [Ramlibacter sp.]|jgi:uncharacterized protein YodC (DUF2158 family)